MIPLNQDFETAALATFPLIEAGGGRMEKWRVWGLVGKSGRHPGGFDKREIKRAGSRIGLGHFDEPIKC